MTRAIERIDDGFVEQWAGEYPIDDRERVLLATVGPAVAERGYYRSSELALVGDWKSSRVRSRLSRNSDADVEDVTRLALAAPDRLKNRILHLLSGVRTPMASAILTVWNPSRFTVIDFRAIETLRAAGELDGSDPLYGPYLQLCRRLAQETQTDLRTLDRALWAWSKKQGKASEPDDDDPDGDTNAIVEGIES